MSYRHFYILHFVFYNLSRRMTGFYIFHRLIHISEFILPSYNPLRISFFSYRNAYDISAFCQTT